MVRFVVICCYCSSKFVISAWSYIAFLVCIVFTMFFFWVLVSICSKIGSESRGRGCWVMGSGFF